MAEPEIPAAAIEAAKKSVRASYGVMADALSGQIRYALAAAAHRGADPADAAGDPGREAVTAFWALAGRARAEAAQPAAPAPEPPPEEPKDCIVILTFENGRRDPSCASLMTAADARTEADVWRKRMPDSANPGRVTASVHKIGEPL